MSEQQKPFRVETAINAPLDTVWRALTEPAEIRQWHGWDYPGLDDEIRFIYVDHARRLPPDRIVLENGQEIRLTADGPLTRVAGFTTDQVTEGDDSYDTIEEGWRSFFEQLRYWLERQPSGNRRTVYLAGTAGASGVLDAIEAGAAKETWHESLHQRMVIDREGHLVVVQAQRPLESGEAGWTGVTITTYGLDDTAFSDVRERWAARWQNAAEDREITP